MSYDDAIEALKAGETKKPDGVSNIDWENAREYACWKGDIGPGKDLRECARALRASVSTFDLLTLQYKRALTGMAILSGDVVGDFLTEKHAARATAIGLRTLAKLFDNLADGELAVVDDPLIFPSPMEVIEKVYTEG